MDRNKLSELVHENAKNKGFWRDKKGYEHYLMLIVTEISEMVEAHRTDMYAKVKMFNENINTEQLDHTSHYEHCFRIFIKNTVEDEFADVAIRILDLSGSLGIDFDRMHPSSYYRAFDNFSFTENAFALTKGLCKEKFSIEKRLAFGLDYIERWAENRRINLDWHIKMKMKYNEGRASLHGKRY